MDHLLPGVRAGEVDGRIRTHYLESGPSDGEPVVFVHGNLSTGRFFEHLMPGAPERWRLLAPDMRGFGRSEQAPIDATRGLGDWADDLVGFLDALGVDIAQRSLVGEPSDVGNDLLVAHLGEPGRAAHLERG